MVDVLQGLKSLKKNLDPQWNESVDVYIPKETTDGTGIFEMKFVVYTMICRHK